MEQVFIGTRDLGGEGARIPKPLDSNQFALALREAVIARQQRRFKVYEMLVQVEGMRYRLTTTEKDIFLRVGNLGPHGQMSLCELVQNRVGSDGKLLIVFVHEETYRGILCQAKKLLHDLMEILVTDVKE